MSVAYNEAPASKLNQEICIVCRHDLKNEENVYHETAKGSPHELHRKCARAWAINSDSCPICNIDLDTRSLLTWKDKTVKILKHFSIFDILYSGALIEALSKVLPNVVEAGFFRTVFSLTCIAKCAMVAIPKQTGLLEVKQIPKALILTLGTFGTISGAVLSRIVINAIGIEKLAISLILAYASFFIAPPQIIDPESRINFLRMIKEAGSISITQIIIQYAIQKGKAAIDESLTNIIIGIAIGAIAKARKSF